MGQVVDVARAQGVGMDSFIHRWSDRLFRRDPSTPSGRAAVAGAAAGSGVNR